VKRDGISKLVAWVGGIATSLLAIAVPFLASWWHDADRQLTIHSEKLEAFKELPAKVDVLSHQSARMDQKLDDLIKKVDDLQDAQARASIPGHSRAAP
jgi:hypothetical protein